jgi:formylglycine-generating enzyme required for sulfatase activity
VSNAEYKRFVEATGCPAPPTWKGVEFAAIADLPVVGIRWGEAILFAEWCGKRLPTLLEWQVAARGREGRPLPWGDERELVVAHSNAASGLASAFADYLRLAEPVTSRPQAASPFGLLRTLDNVTEWCEGFSATGVHSEWLNYGYALRLGGSYVSSPQDVSLALIASSETDKYFHNTGLRCARTHAP